MVKPLNIFFLLLIFSSNSYTQLVFEQGIVNGGITAAGFSAGLGAGSGQIHLEIPSGSTIKKAYAFTYRMGFPPPSTFLLNGNTVVFDTTHLIMNVGHINPLAKPVKAYYKDITNLITPASINNSVSTPFNENLPINWGYWTFSICVIFENLAMTETNYCILINNQKLIGNENYAVSNLNPINSNYPVGFSIFTDLCADETIAPITNVFLNSNYLGKIGGSDNTSYNYSRAGVKGHFSYYNHQLFGIDDDTPDVLMDSTDALANINSYVTNFANSCSFQLKNISFPNISTENKLFFFLAYTSPCAFFPTTNSQDTTVCKGAYLQLSASGGVNYSWEPATGLSCANCPNPVVQTDSSQVYTVRIWNNDSCSVVRPIPVRVNQLPKFGSIASTASACAADNGKIVATAAAETTLPVSYSFNTNPFQFSSTNTSTFSNLAAGTYPLSLKDGNGCVRDTAVVVSLNNNVNALFTASPTSGAHPLVVNFNNQSTNATNFAWKINGVSVGNNLPSYTFTSAGTNTVQLFAWNNNPNCIDSFSLQLFVYDSLLVQVPNVFTPNNDGTNETFSLQSNVPIVVEASIINRWGEIVFNGTIKAISNNGSYTTELWDGKNATDSVYFYTLKCSYLNQSKKLEGFVSLVR